LIRLVHLLRRRPELSLVEFQARWRDDHGPLVAAHQTRLGIARHIQTHRLDDPFNQRIAATRDEIELAYDGVAETWWPSEEAMVAAMLTAAGQAAGMTLLTNESEFIDLPNSPLWLAHDYPQYSNSSEPVVARTVSGIVKLHFPIRHRSDMTIEAAQRYWLTTHGPLGRSFAPMLGLLSYQQVHRFATPIEARLREERGTMVEPYMGHAEMWIDRLFTRAGAEIDEARRLAIEDERRFIDFSRSALWAGKEHVLVDRW